MLKLAFFALLIPILGMTALVLQVVGPVLLLASIVAIAAIGVRIERL